MDDAYDGNYTSWSRRGMFGATQTSGASIGPRMRMREAEQKNGRA